MEDWEKLTLPEALKKLGSGDGGLDEAAAAERLKASGPNEIRRTRKSSPLLLLLRQFTSPLIILLIGAALVSLSFAFIPGAEHDITDTFLILIIVVLSGAAGFFQDWKAEKAIEALGRMATPKATVVRGGREMVVDSTTLVAGDVVLVEAGDVMPADCRVIASTAMTVDESILTGESRSVSKKAGDAVYMDTGVLSGSARLLVCATGMRTRVGSLAGKMQEIEETKTPFQAEISEAGRRIFWVVAAVAVLIALVGYFKYGFYEAMLLAVSLAVAAIPEGLPAVVTLALAIGAKSMVKRNALIRRLPVVESIGSVDIICTDKTGTLTKNSMTVTRVLFNEVVTDSGSITGKDAARMEQMLKCGALCNNVKTVAGPQGRRIVGDQTEVAIMNFSEKHGILKREAELHHERILEIPFDPKRKMMSVLFRHGGEHVVYAKGAPEILLGKCTHVLMDGRPMKLDAKMKADIIRQNSEFASHALRVLGFAFRRLPKRPDEADVEKRLVFLGLEGMLDPPRDEVKAALADCASAGIRVIMITGDNAETAKAIAGQIGLESAGVLTGDDVQAMKDGDLVSALDSGVSIFARTDPFHKLRILELLAERHRVAMTGDGVNDALALKKAHVGIAMGLRGTEVAKEASDIILLDDNFATIRNAVSEGRRIFENIRKFVNYLLSCNIAEVLVIFLGTLFFSLREPVLLPAHILWINLLTDGMPALALGADPAPPDIMKKRPKDMRKGILDRKALANIGTMGVNLAFFLLLAFWLNGLLGLGDSRTLLFTAFVFYEFIRIAAIRYHESLDFFDNKWLVLSLALSMLLQLAIVYTPLGALFGVTAMEPLQWLLLVVIGALGFATSLVLVRLVDSRFREGGDEKESG